MLRVTYLSHSGFYLETEHADFLFDYYKGKLPEPKKSRPMYVFVSHVHFDHFRKEIFSLRDMMPEGLQAGETASGKRLAENGYTLTYILSSDVKSSCGLEAEEANVYFMKPNEERKFDGCKVLTLRSTDEGVAFLIQYDGKTIYHAGDLNWWHWEEEGPEFNTQMRRNYQREINRLSGMKIDIAFVPVDPRLGEQYFWGLDCFMKRTDTKMVFPMHFWKKYGIFERLTLEKSAEEYIDRVRRIEREGQVFEEE